MVIDALIVKPMCHAHCEGALYVNILCEPAMILHPLLCVYCILLMLVLQTGAVHN